MSKISEVLLRVLAPPSIAGDEGSVHAMEALDGELYEVQACIEEALIVSRIRELPEGIVDLLAWQWHVDFYPPGIPLETKRNLVESSIPWHRKKGTLWAVKRLCEDVFGRAEVSEWFEYGGQPYHFRVATEGRLTGSEPWRLFFKSMDMAKNVRSHLDEVTILRPLTLDIRHSNPLLTAGLASVAPPLPVGPRSPLKVGVGHSKRGFIKLTTRGG